MNAPLSDYWAVEYHFQSDNFSVRELPDYLTHAQRSCRDGQLWLSVILALHPTRSGAIDECKVWAERRDKSPLTPKQRAEQLGQYAAALERTL